METVAAITPVAVQTQKVNAITLPETEEAYWKEVFDSPEGEFMRQYPNLYAFARTAANFIPFARFAFLSGRREFEEQPIGGKALDLSLDAASIVPIAFWGKGLKLTRMGVKKLSPLVSGKARALKELSVLEHKLPKYVSPTVEERLISKYRISLEEAKIAQEWVSPGLRSILGKGKPIFWSVPGRSGGVVQMAPSEEFSKLLTEGGKLRKEVKRDILKWKSMTPEQAQRKFYEEGWMETLEKFPEGKLMLTRKENILQEQAEKVLGIEGARGITWENASPELMANLWVDLIEHPHRVRQMVKVGGSYLVPSFFRPVRKVMGAGETVWGMRSNIEVPLGLAVGAANKFEYESIVRLYELIKDAGLGTFQIVKEGKIKFKPSYTKEDWAALGILARWVDDMTGSGASVSQIQAGVDAASSNVQKLYLKVYRPWTDHLYKEHFVYKVAQIFEDAQLSDVGRHQLTTMLNGKGGLLDQLDELFSPNVNAALDHDLYAIKLSGMQQILFELRNAIRPEWFTRRKPKELASLMDELRKELTIPTKRGEGRYPSYVENYASRVGARQKSLAIQRATALSSDPRHVAYVHRRLSETAEWAETNTSLMIEARARAQGRELFIFPRLPGIVEKAKSLPRGYKDYVEHYISRMLGEPSVVDEKLGDWLTRSVGSVERGFHLGTGEWDARRIRELGYRLNDLVYLAGLGFKPFSAIRNLFQVLLNVPTDLGGLKDLGWMLRGYRWMVNPENRAWVRQIGGIQEYAPDIYLRARAPDFGIKPFGVQLPTLQSIRDAGLWMFQASDRFCRYTTAGAAASKWDHYAAKFLTDDRWEPSAFMSVMKFHGRDSWVRRDLEHLIGRASEARRLGLGSWKAELQSAKELFTKDVIADTQWLYGIANAPSSTYRGGILGKTGFVFQSWWMNYITALEKWALRTDLPLAQRMNRVFTFMLSAAISYELMTTVLGFRKRTALSSIGVGPIPRGFDESIIPPVWAPIYHGLRAVYGAVEGTYAGDFEMMKKAAKAAERSAFMFVPGGLQFLSTWKRSREEGFPGFAKSLIGYYGK